MAPTTKSKRVAKSKPSIPSVAKQDSALVATNKSVTDDDEAPSEAVAESSSAGQSPVTPEQVLKASRALLKYFETKSTSEPAGKPNLLEEDGDETGAHGIFSSDQVWLVVTTKKNIASKKELKPKPVKIPHPLLNPETTSALLLVKDPQRTFKDIIIPSSPTVRRVLGLSKLRAKFKTYESLRQLRDSHDLILADERIIPTLRNTLGSSFLRSTTKIPIPVRISKSNGSPATQEAIAKEVKKAVEATYIHLSQTNSTNIRVGLVKHSAAQLVENIMVLIDHMITKRNIVQSGWKGVRGVFIKSGTSASLPLYLSEVLYEENEDFTTEEQRKRRKEEVEQKKRERAERQKAKKTKQLAAKKGISSATGATELNMVTTAQSTEQVDKKRKVDENLEKTNEAIGKGSPKNKKQKVLAVPNKKVDTANPALEKIKVANPKGSKDGKKNSDTPVPLLQEEATPADVATVPTSKAAPKAPTNPKGTASKSQVAEKATEKTEESQEAAKQRPASKRRKEPNGDSKVETAKEEPKRRSKRVGTAGK